MIEAQQGPGAGGGVDGDRGPWAGPGRRPRVGVVIPTRDRRRLLGRALGTVLGQRGVTVEVLVIDDGSRDGTSDALAALADDRVRVIRHPVSQGVSRARNAGIGAVRAPWTAFLDDDDVWAPDKLSRQLALAGPGVSLVYCGAAVIDEGGHMTSLRRTPAATELERGGIRETNLIGSPSGVLASTDALRAVGGFDERLGILADWDLWIRLLARGRAALAEGALLGYTVHPENMHLGDPARLRDELARMRRTHRDGGPIGGERFERWLVRRYRAAGRRRQAARVYAGLGWRLRSPRDLARAGGVLLGEGAMRRAGGRFEDEPAGRDGLGEPAWLAGLREPSGSGRIVL